jgi:hypothetical protein
MLIWERIVDSVIAHTDWQCWNEARVDGAGPVVATVSRRIVPHVTGTSGEVFTTRVRGKTIDEDWTVAWHSPEEMRAKEKLAEEAFAKEGT